MHHCRYKPCGARDLPLEMESRILKSVDYLLNLKKSEQAFVESGSKASPPCRSSLHIIFL